MDGINLFASLSPLLSARGNAATLEKLAVISWPKDFTGSPKGQTLTAEISKLNKDGSFFAKIAQGDVQIRPPSLASYLVGQKLSLQVPAGSLPDMVTAIPVKQEIPQSSTTQIYGLNEKAALIATRDIATLQTTLNNLATSPQNPSKNIVVEVGQMVRLTKLPDGLPSSAIERPITLIQARLNNISGAASAAQQNLNVQNSSQPIESSITNTNFLKSPRLLSFDPLSLQNISALKLPDASVEGRASVSISRQEVSATQNLTINDARVNAITQPQGAAQRLSPMVGNVMGVVTPFLSESGNPIIQLHNAGAGGKPDLFIMHYPAKNLDIGTQLIFTPLPKSSSGSNNLQNMMLQSTSFAIADVEQALDMVKGQLPLPAAQSLMQSIPNPSMAQTFPAAAVLFLAAAQNGDLSGWLGNRARTAIDQSSPNLKQAMMESLNNVLGAQNRAVSQGGADGPPNFIQSNTDWRHFMMPIAMGENLQKMNFWTQAYGEDEDNLSPAQKSTRFVVDLDLSKMGEVVIDGIVRPLYHRLDIVLYTKLGLSQKMQQSMNDLWHNTLSALEMQGNIKFKQGTA